jgi:hypothetical protein
MGVKNKLYQEIRYCEKCGKKFYNKFMDYDFCYDCLEPIHEEIHKKLGTKIIYETKIDYKKYDPYNNQNKTK